MPSVQHWKTPKAGNLATLALQESTLPPRSKGKVRVTVKAVGLNFADIFALTGLYSATPEGSFVPGLEFSGVVESVEDSGAFQPGDRVMGLTRFGGYSSVIDSEPGYLIPLPADWDFSQGAAWPVQTLTAWYALTHLGAIDKGHRVLVHSAAGGVGLQAMKLCKALGATPIGTVGNTEKAHWLVSQGFEQVLVRDTDFMKQLSGLSEPLDLVLDAIGGKVQQASFAALAPMGRLVVFGAAEFTPTGHRPNYLKAAWRYLRRPRYDVMDMISSNRSVLAFNLIWLWEQKTRLQGLLQELTAVEIAPPHVGHSLPFEEAHQALALLQSGKTCGKVVLTLP